MSKIRSRHRLVKITQISERFTILHDLKGLKKEDFWLFCDSSF
jgi:hypothetical protein